MIGIKFQPAALTYLFDIDQSSITDQVIPLTEPMASRFKVLAQHLNTEVPTHSIFTRLNQLFQDFSPVIPPNTGLDAALTLLLSQHGNLNMSELRNVAGCSERQLERWFRRFVGLAPKFYARIIRLAYTFELMQEGNKSWCDLVYDSGFYDQSHFIKNFKEFTGEDPSTYGFDEQNMANFHLHNPSERIE
jgi:AraC-like DNA-binding protein